MRLDHVCSPLVEMFSVAAWKAKQGNPKLKINHISNIFGLWLSNHWHEVEDRRPNNQFKQQLT